MSFHKQENGAVVEVGVFSHEAKTFSALGSVVDPASGIIIGYVSHAGGKAHLTTWDGDYILPIVCVSTWDIRNRHTGERTRMCAYRATDAHGVRYSGRGLGDGMLLRLRAQRGAI